MLRSTHATTIDILGECLFPYFLLNFMLGFPISSPFTKGQNSIWRACFQTVLGPQPNVAQLHFDWMCGWVKILCTFASCFFIKLWNTIYYDHICFQTVLSPQPNVAQLHFDWMCGWVKILCKFASCFFIKLWNTIYYDHIPELNEETHASYMDYWCICLLDQLCVNE
jgi:membrane protein YqaA with SNARE-associated domain